MGSKYRLMYFRTTAPDVDLECSQGKLDHYVPPFRVQDANSKSKNHERFTLVGEAGQNVTLSSKLQKTAELFDIISNNGSVDHPLCEECTDTLLETMDQQLKLAEDEAQEYQAFLQKLENESEDDSRVSLEEELQKLQLEESSLREELESLKGEQQQAEDQLKSQKAEKDKLEKEEQKYWKEYSRHKRQLLIAEDEFRSLVSSYSFFKRYSIIIFSLFLHNISRIASKSTLRSR